LEGLEDAEDDREGTLSSFTSSSLWFLSWLRDISRFVALITRLKKTMSEEKAVWLDASRGLTKEKAARQSVDQSLQSSNEANTLLAKELDSTQASLTTTTDKLSSKSFALDHSVIWEQQMKIQLEACEEKLTGCEERLTVANDKHNAVEEKMKTQGQLLDSAQQALSKQELSSLVVANTVALIKNHLPDLDMEILHKNITVDDAEWETLVNNTYNAAHNFFSPCTIFQPCWIQW
jgi:chromosome segregation ATPase